MTAALCSHCFLPIRGVGQSRQVDGEEHRFCCYGCCLAYQVAHDQSEESDAVRLLIRFGVGAFLAMNIMLFSLLLYAGAIDPADHRLLGVIHLLLWGMATPALVILGGPFVAETWRELLCGRLASSALIVLGAGSAYIYSSISILIGAEHVYFDTLAMVLVLFTLGRYVEAVGRARAVRSLAPMLAAEKQSVAVLENGAERLCPACDVTPGTIVLIRPGERIGVDGSVIEGRSHADEAAMTGESRLIEKGPGSRVLAGAINGNGMLTVRSECVGTATHWARICRSVRQSLRQGHQLQRVADRVATAFIPIVLLIALGTVWWWHGSVPLDEALLRGLAVLVVACPCALGLATPLASSLGVGRLARHGCVVRGAAVTEALAQIRAIAFDKTGTLTSGEPCLVEVIGDGLSADEVLCWTAGVERYAEHPLASGIMRAIEERALVPKALTDIQAVPGCGVRGRAMGRTVVVGSRNWILHLGASMSADLAERARSAETLGRTVVCLTWADRVHGLLLFEDTVRPEAGTMVRAIRQLGLETGILSGASRGVVDRIGDLVGIERKEAELSPEGKQASLERWRRSFGPVAMVGDGLNDGPVLAAADVGVAIGSATDLAREAADLVLSKSGLALLPWSISLARAVRRTILTNLIWAFGYNFIAIALAATGFLQPIAAAAVMAGSSLVVVLNSLQIERHGEPDTRLGLIVAPQAQSA